MGQRHTQALAQFLAGHSQAHRLSGKQKAPLEQVARGLDFLESRIERRESCFSRTHGTICRKGYQPPPAVV